MGIYLNQSKTSLSNLQFNKSKTTYSIWKNWTFFEKYRSYYIDRAYIEHYQTTGADVEATQKIS